jgi:hypothetical protein
VRGGEREGQAEGDIRDSEEKLQDESGSDK